MGSPSAADENPLEPERVSPGLELEGDSSGSELDGESPDSELDRDSLWLQTLSEPELDFLIGLKELAVTQTQSAGQPDLSRIFHLRTLRALGVVLLEHFKDRLKQTSVDGLSLLRDVPNTEGYQDQRKEISFDGLALLMDVGNAEGYQDHPLPNGVNMKRKQLQHGATLQAGEESSSKRRKMERELGDGKATGR